MSSILFQPLLHDPLGWKQSNTTYNDTFKSRSYAGPSNSTEKKLSPYGQQYQRLMRKQQEQMKLYRSNPYFEDSSYEEEEQQLPTPRVILWKKNEEFQEAPSAVYQLSRSNTMPVASDDLSGYVVEWKKQPGSTHRETVYDSVQRLPTASAASRARSLEARQDQKEESGKRRNDSKDNFNRHWLTYANPKTPPKIIDIKQRLGQLKAPSTLSRSLSGYNEKTEAYLAERRQKNRDPRHLLDCDIPDTPQELRAARHRIEKHRYHQSLDNFPPQQQTYRENIDDYSKPSVVSEYEDEQLQHNQTTLTNDGTEVNDEENEAPVNESSSGVLQTADGDEFPGDYVDPSEASEEAYDEYVRNLKANDEKRSENNTLYRLPSTADQQESCVAYCQQQQQQPPTYSTKKKNSEIRRNEFDTWIRNATDKEREQAMKMLNAVVNRPIMGYDIPKKPQPVLFKPSPVITPGRTASNSRQLGQARNHQRVPCDICEKQLIKHHIWSLSRSTSLNCPHQD
ncbi:unnamed protein product [Adineta steineri]|uniref:Uncharacterized protein n=1 Tax=Adineta steineri TaxID=433720 RepID=A0A815GEB9_9BILA|nr:unnamed protein product [Adineta steineri]